MLFSVLELKEIKMSNHMSDGNNSLKNSFINLLHQEPEF